MSEEVTIFVTGDGVCPWCGREVIGDDVTTHHTHRITKGEMKDIARRHINWLKRVLKDKDLSLQKKLLIERQSKELESKYLE